VVVETVERGPYRAYVHENLTVVEERELAIAKWDLEGRPVSAQMDDVYYRRGISHDMMARGRLERAGRILGEEERRAALERMRGIAGGALRTFSRERGGHASDLALRLGAILAKDIHALEEEGRRFLRIYRPVPILPPDRTLAFVVQITEGCPWNRCSFCGLYPDRVFRAKEEDEVERHVRDALEFFGRSILLRRSLFLGDGDPFVLPDARLVPLVDRLTAALRSHGAHGAPLKDLYAFARIASLAARSPRDWEPYRQRGLRRVYIGVETGDPALYEALRKPGSPADLPAGIAAAKDAGIAAGIIFLVGVGGRRFREAHREGTVRLVSSLPLDERDLVYLSPLREVEGSDYALRAAREGWEALGRAEMAAEAAAIARGLHAGGSRAKTAYYPVEHFVY
jgi:radical SAM superfamily enzyme YgiQ (UPF0313 family)